MAEPGVAFPERSSARVLRDMLRDPLESVPRAVYDHRLVVTRNFGRTRVYVSDPALIHEALVGRSGSLDKSYETKRVLGPAIGSGLLTADGSHWRWQRQALSPVFQPRNVATFGAAMIKAAEAARDRWAAMGPGSIVELGHEMTAITFAIIVETMIAGADVLETGAIERNMADYLDATPMMFGLALIRAPRSTPYPGRRRALRSAQRMRALVGATVAARRRAGSGAEDLVALLLGATDPETGRRFTDEEIVDNILTFVTAGHETTAVALGWAAGLLAAHPAHAAAMRDEIEAVTGGGPLLPEHLDRLEATRRVVEETLRLYPPAPLIARTVVKPFELAGVPLPAGSSLLVPIHAVHRHAGTWPEPERFMPERFETDAVRGRHRFAFMPFGAGPRVCIGGLFAMTEAVAITAVLLRAFTLEPTRDTLPPPRTRITLRPADPIRLRIAARH